MAKGLYDREVVEEAVAGLINGHLLVAGPPGTGKTQLARHLADAFNVQLVEETANPEWSVFDTVGAEALPGSATPHRDGLVTRAILRCGNMTVAHMDTGEPPQAAWLLIDEINRAEIDRAFGPMFTALSADNGGSFTLDYRAAAPVLAVPRRFRLIATMNSYDTRFVNTMSAALRRRFARVNVLPPANEGTLSSEAEVRLALSRAATLVATRTGVAIAALQASVEDHLSMIRSVFGALRGIPAQGGTPIGTAQVIDTLVLLLTLMAMSGVPADEDKFLDLLDRAVSGRVMSSVESDATRLHLKEGYAAAFEQLFPKLTRTNTRLTSFLIGGD
jgi:MoxR-like ATPase